MTGRTQVAPGRPGEAPFGALLRASRRAAGLTQEALAERAALSVRGLQHLEAGDARPYPATLEALAAALDLAPAERARLRAAVPAAPPPRARGRPAGAGSSNLPLPLTGFVGRERELAEVARLLGAARLLTLTGPGGTGKTRLALRAAADALEAYPDGVWLVELAPLADPALVVAAVAAAVGVREEPGRPLLGTLAAALRPRRLLLVLDNCEHLLAGVGPLAAALLGACPGLRVLATSRAALRVSGEQELPVPPLALPDPTGPPDPAAVAQSEAVALFVQRAASVAPAFRLTAQNAAAVAAICARLDGLPLALELAAARVGVLPPRALLARLARRLAVLTGGPRDAPARQQTLRATLDWSHALLAPPERALFRQLAVFAGGWTLEAAEAVSNAGDDSPADALEALASLVDQSLVRREGPEAGGDGEPRFVMLETIREYATERLDQSGEAAAARRAHAAYFLALAEQAAQASAEGGAAEVPWSRWVERLEHERDNLRAALRRAVAGAAGRDPEAAERGLRLAVALTDFWASRGPVTEGRQWLTALLAGAAPPADALRAAALVAAGELSSAQDELEAARARCAEALAIYRRLDDHHGIARTLFALGMLAGARGELDAAHALLEESLGAGRVCGDAHGAALPLTHLAVVARLQRHHAEARRLLEQGLAIRRRAGDRWHIAESLCQLGLLAYVEGDAAAARALLHEATTLQRDLGDQGGLAQSLDAHAALAAAQAEPERALRLAGAATAVRETIGWAPWPSVQREAAEWLRPARRALDEAAAADAWAAGRAMPLEQAVAYALEEARDSA